MTGEERHASWLELFFDLVAVAGIGMLAQLLEEDTSRGGLAVYVIAYTAIWMIWACFTVYGNIAGQQTHVTVILGAMFVLGVMAAAVPEIRGEHAAAFAVAYVVGRFSPAGRGSARRSWSTCPSSRPASESCRGSCPGGSTGRRSTCSGRSASGSTCCSWSRRTATACWPASRSGSSTPSTRATTSRTGPSTSSPRTSRTSPSGSACSC